MEFKELLNNISPTLKRIVYKLRWHSVFINQDDLFQEALLHLWQDYNCGRLRDKTESYILQGCYFYLKNYIRRSVKKARLVSLSGEGRDKEDDRSIENQIADSFDKSFYLDYLNNKMLAETIQNNGLEPKEKEILRFYSQGFTTRQIGERLCLSHVRVVKLTQRIRAKCLRYKEGY